MTLADTIQGVSLAAIAIALVLNYQQARETGRQATEASKQVQLSATIIKQEAYRQLTQYGTNFNAVLFGDNHDLLAWFLSSRGIPVDSHDANLRRIFMFVRMDVHESVYLSYTAGDLEERAWTAWQNVIEADAATAEFRLVWQVVSNQYVAEYSAFITALLQRQDAG